MFFINWWILRIVFVKRIARCYHSAVESSMPTTRDIPPRTPTKTKSVLIVLSDRAVILISPLRVNAYRHNSKIVPSPTYFSFLLFTLIFIFQFLFLFFSATAHASCLTMIRCILWNLVTWPFLLKMVLYPLSVVLLTVIFILLKILMYIKNLEFHDAIAIFKAER